MGKLLLALALVLGLALPGWAAVANDANATNNSFNACPTVSITVGSGSSRAIIAVVMFSGGTTPAVTSMSGGATWAGTTDGTFTAGSGRTEVWHGTNPTSGAQTITTNTSGTISECVVLVVTFSGVDQTTPVAAFTSGNTYGLTVTTVSGDAAVVGLSTNDALAAINGCQASDDLSLSSNAQYKGAHCLASSTSTTITWNSSGATYATAGIAVKQSSGGTVVPARTLTGVGL